MRSLLQLCITRGFIRRLRNKKVNFRVDKHFFQDQKPVILNFAGRKLKCRDMFKCQTYKMTGSAQSPVIGAFGTASANSVESDLGCTSRVIFDNVSLTSHKVT